MLGYAIDYSRANAVKADLQSALDAAALMVSKTASTLTADQLQSTARSYFGALFKNPEGFSYTVDAAYNASGGSSVTLTGLTSVRTDFLGILGYHTIDVSSTATVKVKNRLSSVPHWPLRQKP